MSAQTVLLDYEITIQPIFMENGSGTTAVLSTPANAAKLSLFKDATQMIFAQAGVRVNWLPNHTYSNSGFYVIDGVGYGNQPDVEMKALVETAGHGQNTDPRVLNLWFTGPGGSVYGVSEQSMYTNVTASLRNGVTISETVFTVNSLDVIAHEIGHNLALTHYSILNPLIALTVSSLMYEGDTQVTALNQIFPKGIQYDQLSALEIAKIKGNLGKEDGIDTYSLIQLNTVIPDYYTYTVVPEPPLFALISGSLVGIVSVVRSRLIYNKKKNT